ncbi:MAG: COX15/CtaA family protein [Rickettsiales bacterium]
MNLNIKHKKVAFWSFYICILLIFMIGIGGYTRLTDSGLSIVEWKPVTGIWYPVTDQGWQQEFNKYQNSPEYKQVNFAMSLAEFKKIYFVEYFHRLFGRMLGVFFFVPFVFFAVKKYFMGKDIYKFFGVLLLGGFQGFVGWYMVTSGLVKDPHVSHFRLSFHLVMAIFIYACLFWQGLNYLSNNFSKRFTLFNKAGFLLVLAMLQIFYGGLVAGLDAGKIYNQFPMMGDSLIPKEMRGLDILEVLFYNPVTVQFIHRFIGVIFACMVIFITYRNWRKDIHHEVYLLLSLMVLVQFCLGVMTLITEVNIQYALLHQIVAVLIISNLLLLSHSLIYRKS